MNWLGIGIAATVVAATAVGGAAIIATSGPLAERSALHTTTLPSAPVPPERTPVVTVRTLAGAARDPRTTPGFADGPSAEARLGSGGLAMAKDGTIVFADSENHRIRRLNGDGTVETLAGSGNPGYADGTPEDAQFCFPADVAFLPDGSLVVADAANHRVRHVAPNGAVTTLAGDGATCTIVGPGHRDGPAATALFSLPKGIAADSSGAIYVADTDNFRIRRIDSSGQVRTIAGSGSHGFEDGAALIAKFSNINKIALGEDGSIYVSDQPNNAIRRIANGMVTTVIPPSAGLLFPSGVAISRGLLWVSDSGNGQIKAFELNGTFVATAGSSAGHRPRDGAGASAFLTPGGLAAAGDGGVIFSDEGGQIRKAEVHR